MHGIARSIRLTSFNQDGAFDEAVRDVDAIEHTASPATLKSEEPDGMNGLSGNNICRLRLTMSKDYIKPAIQGTLGILESARKFGYVIQILFKYGRKLTLPLASEIGLSA